ncbi:MAG: crotonase/enoyl-CoA hydratase family protein [Rhizobiaceae bacterium]|nr:crotonase/enoyl-CoA hydratase family protein [Rhizobiaceae bacterium]
MSEFISTSVADGVLTVRMNRPDKKNAIDRPMYRSMADALHRADADETIGATLIAGVSGAFSAGNDIRDFIAFALGGERTGEVEAFLKALAGSRKPLVAAVDGLAIGIGTTMLMHCDLVFAAPGSTFRTPFLDLGLVPEAGSSLIAPKLMGHQRAFALLAMGATFDAEEAKAANLVYRVVRSEEVETMAMDAAIALAAKPRQALAIGRELIRGPREALIERIDVELKHFEERLQSKEARVAFEAFMTKR